MDVLETVLRLVLIGGGVVYLSVCLAAFSGHFRTLGIQDGYIPSVSVIIAARNEEATIGFLLEDLLKQDYPPEKLEIVVVDDCSDDATGSVVNDYIARDPNIRLIDTRNSKTPYSHKKQAIHEGIKSSQGEIIIITDADCRIQPGRIRGMVNHFTPDVDLVAGDVIIEGGGLLGLLEALEMTGIQEMAAGLMNGGFPVTCNGANIAYRRAAFERVGGFEHVGRLVSGDDDLLMQKIAHGRPSRVVYLSGRNTAVYTDAVRHAGEFFSRRVRWASKIGSYPSVQAVMLLSIFFGFFAAVILWLGLAAFNLFGLWPFAAGFGMKAAGDFLLTFSGTYRMKRLRLMLVFPFAEVLHIPYILFVTVKGFFGSFVWQGRRLTAVSLEYGEKNND